MMTKFENEYEIIKYNKKTHEIAIVHWAKYNMNKLGGKPILDCISKEIKKVEDASLLKVVLEDITRPEIRRAFQREIELRNNKADDNMAKKGEIKKHEFGTYSKSKFTSKIEAENDSLYEKPSEEQIRKLQERYN